MKTLITLILFIFSYSLYSQDTTGLKVLYLDDFGHIDLSDTSVKTFKVWDYYSSPDPKEVTLKTSTPFRRMPFKENEPIGCVFSTSGGVMDFQYCIAGYMTSYSSYNGIKGAMLQWAANTTGQPNIPTICYDHSGEIEGACLLINIPRFGIGNFYQKVIPNLNLCSDKTTKVIIEAFITVFSNEKNGIDITLSVDGGYGVKSSRHTATKGQKEWVRIADTINVFPGSQININISKNYNSELQGSAFTIDDIKVYTNEPNTCELTALYFNTHMNE